MLVGVVALTLAQPAAADTVGKVRVKKHLRPGHRVAVHVSRFPAGARVRLQFGVDYRPPANCCVTHVIPRRSRPAFRLGGDGRRTLRVKMPRRYAQCVSVSCRSPRYTRWKHGQRIYVFVATNHYGRGDPGEAHGRAITHVR